MKHKLLSFALVLLLLCGVLTACSPATASSGIPTDQKPVVTVSSVKAALTIEEMADSCMIVAYGTISKIGDCVDVPETNITHTTYYAAVEEIFIGDSSQKEISFKGVGGESPTKIVLPENKKLPQVGDKAFFFVGKNGVVGSDFFWLKDGKVVVYSYQMPEAFKDSKETSKTYTVEEFTQILRDKIK